MLENAAQMVMVFKPLFAFEIITISAMCLSYLALNCAQSSATIATLMIIKRRYFSNIYLNISCF